MNGVNKMLGVNSQMKKCCIILSNMTFDEISAFLSRFPTAELIVRHDSTNWGGSDDISRACKHMRLALTGRKMKYKGKTHGSDSDHGRSNNWEFEYDEIWEVE